MDGKEERESKIGAKGVTPAIGIDLGTTYSCVGFWQHGQVEIIPNDNGNRTTPSCVAFTNVERLIGEGAKNQVAMNPACTIFGMCFSNLSFPCFKKFELVTKYFLIKYFYVHKFHIPELQMLND